MDIFPTFILVILASIILIPNILLIYSRLFLVWFKTKKDYFTFFMDIVHSIFLISFIVYTSFSYDIIGPKILNIIILIGLLLSLSIMLSIVKFNYYSDKFRALESDLLIDKMNVRDELECVYLNTDMSLGAKLYNMFTAMSYIVFSTHLSILAFL